MLIWVYTNLPQRSTDHKNFLLDHNSEIQQNPEDISEEDSKGIPEEDNGVDESGKLYSHISNSQYGVRLSSLLLKSYLFIEPQLDYDGADTDDSDSTEIIRWKPRKRKVVDHDTSGKLYSLFPFLCHFIVFVH